MGIKIYHKDIDYCRKIRRNIPISEKIVHLREVSFRCPICGRSIFGKNNKDKIYEIAHIFPHSPKDNEKKILDGVELLGEDSESFENKIALCETCHHKYDTDKTVEEYNNLVSIKKKLSAIQKTDDELASINIDNDIVKVLEVVAKLSDEEFDKLEKYKSLKIDNKIEDKYSLLKRKIKHYVSEYYLFIEEQLRNLDEKEKKFKIIANQINTAYLSCCTEDKDDVFNNIVNWLNSKDVTLNYDACVIVVSFFVQNCEVFDEVA